MRLALVLVLAWVLVPGLREVAESGVHLLRTGHVHASHAPGSDTDLGDEAPEHSCGTTQHQCGCCSSLPLAAGRAISVAPASDVSAKLAWARNVPPARVGIDRLFRPPIAY